MTTLRRDRRQQSAGSVICENHTLCLYVTHEQHSLGVIIEPVDADAGQDAIALTCGEGDIRGIDAAGVSVDGAFIAFAPLVIHGQTQGVVLHGHLGRAALTATLRLDPENAWCTQHLLVQGLTPGSYRQITQRWQLADAVAMPEVCWPPQEVAGLDILSHPAAFLQEGSTFAALVPDPDEDEIPRARLALRLDEPPCLEYGLGYDGQADRLSLHGALCLDTRALPGRGFQQVVRLLGNREQVTLVTPPPMTAVADDLVWPAALDDAAWHPFVWEGAPEAIIALTADCFTRATRGEVSALETGLVWLDRLCLHQCTVGAPDGQVLGAFGPGTPWQVIAPWMPALLLWAFRLTGNPEYAYRGIAALRVLPEADRARVVRWLYPMFGDIYLNAIYHEVIALTGVRITRAGFTADGLDLACTAPHPTPLRVLMDGIEEQYHLTINDRPLGAIPLDRLRAGITV